MTRWLPWLASAALVAVGGGAVYISTIGLGDTQAATLDYITQAAERTDVTVTSAATGNVASAASYALSFGTAPSIDDAVVTSDQTWQVDDVLVSVGDRVSAGQILAVADAADLEGQIAAAESTLERARLTLSDAEAALAGAPAETRASIRSLNANLMNLKMQLADAREMRDDAASGSDAKRQAKISIINIKLQIEAARDDRAQQKAERKAGYPELTVAIDEAEQNAADLDAQLSDLQDQLALATIVAPVDGTVSALNITAGYTAPSGAAIVVDSDSLEVVASVVESDIGSLAVGQTATVTIDALDEDVAGVVTSVVPTTSASTSSVVSYPVTVTLTDAGSGVLSGMSSDVEIIIDEATDVVAVPVTALAGSDGAYTVQVVDADGTTEVRAVTVGLVTETLAEIQSGLSAGEEVVVGTASDRTQSDDESDGGQNAFGGGFGGLDGGPPAGGPPAGFRQD